MHTTLEEHIDTICPKCKTEHHQQWEDQFHKHEHYRVLTCTCNYKIFIKTPHFTSSVHH